MGSNSLIASWTRVFGSRLASLGVDLVYLLLFVGLAPWLLYLVLVRKRGVGSLSERFGSVPLTRTGRTRVWFHAVSVGELEAALPLIDALAADSEDLDIVISTTTTSAQEVARRKCSQYSIFLFPIDFGLCVRRTLDRVCPDLVVLMELELWPNMILNCHARQIPMLVANGRITERSRGRMSRLRMLVRPLVCRVTRYLVQNEEYAERLRDLGVGSEAVRVAGNLKFDRNPLPAPQAKRREFEQAWGYAADSPRWIAGCTHPGEEALVLEAHRELRQEFPNLTLIIAPRHVERAEEVLALCREHGCKPAQTTKSKATKPEVVVVDEVGILLELYAAADVAFVGGSLVPRGGHNVLEPILAGTPVVHGPYTANFREIIDLLTAGRAVRRVEDGADLRACVRDWLKDSEARSAMVQRGAEVLAAHRGVSQRTVAEILALTRY